ncbi:MAG: methyltransferase domain-containing protein [Thermoplasmatota archaeon]
MSRDDLQKTAQQLLTNLGIKKGSAVLDFGCGNGSYSIATAYLVNKQGLVVAVDESEETIEKLEQKTKEKRFENITTYNQLSAIPPSLHATFNVILAFDVLHYLEENKRNEVYGEFHRLLSSDGLLVIHPKHTKDNHPMWHFSTVTISDLKHEIETVGFQFLQQKTVSLLHDNHLEQGPILILKKRTGT